ncbi:UNVERIFIED_CONTAM: hypothetical protein HDU68_008641 [Siphonaria sp. JEL0065]|nr:hypothetical protein HDU68_008641 [Siphonaria sp. JEL0065]
MSTQEEDQATARAPEAASNVSETFAQKYTESLEERLDVASRLEAAESKANTLICDIRLMKAEADALRKIILESGIGAAAKQMPPPSVLSAYVSTPSTTDSSLVLNSNGQIASSANSDYSNQYYDGNKDEDQYKPSSSRRPSRSRMSSSSNVLPDGTTTAQKNMPSPQSMSQSPQVPKSTIIQQQQQQQQHQEPPFILPSSTPFLPTSLAAPSATALPRKSSTSHTHDHIISPLPPNSLAWTDIIRTRYPYFQRSTVQTSKHAREFIETRKIPFYRVTPTHTLGRSKPTYAIPPLLQKDFLEYFEERFGAIGVLGKKLEEGAVVGGDGIGGSVQGDGIGGTFGGASAIEEQFDVSKGKRKSVSGGSSSSHSFAATPAKRRAVKEEDDAATSAVANGGDAMDGSKRPKSAKLVVSKGGLALTRYNAIVNKMMPDFKTLSNDARLAIKRGVKQFLQHEMGNDFEECLMMTPADNGQTPKPTYGVPDHLVPGFQQWVFVELKKCFPHLVVLPPPASASAA